MRGRRRLARLRVRVRVEVRVRVRVEVRVRVGVRVTRGARCPDRQAAHIGRRVLAVGPRDAAEGRACRVG